MRCAPWLLVVVVVATTTTEVHAQAVQQSSERQGATAGQTPPAVAHVGAIPTPVDLGHALLRVPDPGSEAWLLLAPGGLPSYNDSLAGPPPSPISDQGKGWIILGILAVVVIVFVIGTKGVNDALGGS